MTKTERPILFVDDSTEDHLLVREAVREAGCLAPVHWASRVDEAVAYLSGQPPPLPAFVLLDIQMPRKTGFELLLWLRGRAEDLHRLPVIMFTTSNDAAEMRKAYDGGANSFLVKPIGFDELLETMRKTTSFWLGVNRAP